MPEPFTIIQTTAAVVTALAAAGAFTYVRRGMKLIDEHDRVLYGEDNVDEWNGLVGATKANKQRSKRNRILIEDFHDLDNADREFRGGPVDDRPSDD